MRQLPTEPSATVRRAVSAGALVLLTVMSASACTDAGGGEDPDASGSDSSSPSAEQSEPEEPGSESQGSDEEPDAEGEITPPGTVLGMDDAALVEIPSSTRDRPVGTFSVTVDSVTEQPLSKLPSDGPPPGPSTLVYVEQTYTLVERAGNNDLSSENLLQHSLVWSGDQPIPAYISIAADPQGCSFADFQDSDSEGDSRTSCTAYLVPRGQSVDEVSYISRLTEYDYIDGDPIRWTVDAGA